MSMHHQNNIIYILAYIKLALHQSISLVSEFPNTIRVQDNYCYYRFYLGR